MPAIRRALERVAGLPAPRNVDVKVERDLEAKMADGAILLADRWYVEVSAPSDPIVLIRTPYGRRQFGILGKVFAERGYQVVIQSVRGTFGSGGSFEPFRHEAEDGGTTLEWIASQPWGSQKVGMFGPSYLGLVQWAVAAQGNGQVSAMAAQVTASNARDAVVYPGNSFSLETGATWVDLVEHQELPPRKFVRAMVNTRRRTKVAADTLPLSEADVASVGRRISYYQDWLIHDQPGDPWWAEVDWSEGAKSAPPMSMVGGWYDIFLPAQLADYRRLREAGREVRLTIGPWTHSSPRGGAAGVRDALEWFGSHLRTEPAPLRAKPVRLFVTGARRWVDVDEWPPPATVERWNVHAGGGLSPGPPFDGAASRYTYDPADPAPGLGGATLDLFMAGRRNQRRREQRPDVLVFTSETLASDLTVVGPLTAELSVRGSNAYGDVFVRLCDVDSRGRSKNRADGILRLDPERHPAGPDGSRRVSVEMWPVAHTFRRGHRIRVQVSSAAHPLYARNTGSGEPLASASTLVVSEQELLHDADHPSALLLPISTSA